MGINSSFVEIKLLCLSLVMIITHNELKYLETPFIYNVLKEEELKAENRFIFLDQNKRTPCRLFWHKVEIYFWFGLYYLHIIIPCFQAFFVALLLPTLIGVSFIIAMLVVLYYQRTIFWEHSYYPIHFVTAACIFLIFTIELIGWFLPQDSGVA